MNNVTVKELENAEVEMTASIPADDFASYRAEAIKNLGKDVELDGFRKGNVPEDVLVSKIGEGVIMAEMAELAVAEYYPRILAEKKIAAIGRPEITITKMAAGNPLEFTAKTAVMPEVNLPDYKKIAKEAIGEKEEIIVTDEEVDKTILEIRTNFGAQMTAMNKPTTDNSQPTTGDEKQETENNVTTDDKEKKPELPELNDDFVKMLGDFKDVEDFKAKLRENIIAEKEAKAQEKKRLTIMDGIIDKTDLTVPRLLIDSELDRMMMQFKDNLAMMGHKPEDYFTQIKKTEEEVRTGWEADAIKRVQTQLILHTISEKEKVTVPEEEMSEQIKKVKEQYPNVDDARARSYVENILMNEKTFELLEGATSNK